MKIKARPTNDLHNNHHEKNTKQNKVMLAVYLPLIIFGCFPMSCFLLDVVVALSIAIIAITIFPIILKYRVNNLTTLVLLVISAMLFSVGLGLAQARNILKGQGTELFFANFLAQGLFKNGYEHGVSQFFIFTTMHLVILSSFLKHLSKQSSRNKADNTCQIDSDVDCLSLLIWNISITSIIIWFLCIIAGPFIGNHLKGQEPVSVLNAFVIPATGVAVIMQMMLLFIVCWLDESGLKAHFQGTA